MSYIQTLSGKKFDYLNSTADDVEIEDIDDGSLWPCLEGIPASDIIQIVPLRPGQAYGLFINRFNELTESRACLA